MKRNMRLTKVLIKIVIKLPRRIRNVNFLTFNEKGAWVCCSDQLSFFAPRWLTNNKIHELLNLNLPLINQKH